MIKREQAARAANSPDGHIILNKNSKMAGFRFPGVALFERQPPHFGCKQK